MPKDSKRPLKVFLCHASGDKPQVRALYRRLIAEGVDAWLDQEKLLPGQDWRVEIPRAVREADVVVVCLSNKSITKEGYVQKEIKFALDSADEKPEGTIFLIPARLEECIVPEQVGRWQWVDLYEENGFIKLLRSLKLRADKVGAVIQQSSYEDEDAETELRLEQLYTEGLEAFYTENWDRACQRFQLILIERPNHVGAAEKLEEAERQRNLAKLYAQSMEAYNSEHWQVAVRTLEELSLKSADYKDVASLLMKARKQKQLKELYTEAKKLHSAKKWQAVLKVFDQISIVDPAFPDSDGLLSSAQKEVTELKRLADLNDLYGQAVRRMDVGQWYEAREILNQIHEVEPGFLETERLLAKADIEVKKVEEKQQREDQINTLHEQARGLFRSQMWQEALNKIEEIRKLDEQFADPDQIAKQTQVEIERKEQEIERQDKLTAMYAEAVGLLRERKYQDALETWQEIVKIDPRYPDQHKVQTTSKKKLAELTKSLQKEPRSVNLRQVGIVSAIVITLAIIIWGSFQVLPVSNGIINSPTPSRLAATESPIPSASPMPSAYWHFSNDSDGWSLNPHEISFAPFVKGFLTFTTKSTDPYIFSPRLEIAASLTPVITVRMRLTRTNSRTGAIFFTTDKDTNFDGKKYQSFPLHGGIGFQTCNIDMSNTSTWQGVITQLRLDPVDDPGPASEVQIEIDFIWVRDDKLSRYGCQ